MYLVFTTNWGHKHLKLFTDKNTNNNVYIQLKYVAFVKIVYER